MSRLRIKPGASLRGLRPEMSVALTIIFRVFASEGYDCVVTCGTDGSHSRNSLHYVGLAVDVRRRHLPKNMPERIAGDLREVLAGEFDVVLERTHIHVEYQPEGPA